MSMSLYLLIFFLLSISYLLGRHIERIVLGKKVSKIVEEARRAHSSGDMGKFSGLMKHLAAKKYMYDKVIMKKIKWFGK